MRTAICNELGYLFCEAAFGLWGNGSVRWSQCLFRPYELELGVSVGADKAANVLCRVGSCFYYWGRFQG